jgi:hypothetical protein
MAEWRRLKKFNDWYENLTKKYPGAIKCAGTLITIFLALIAIYFTISSTANAAYNGAKAAYDFDKQKSELETQNIAKLIRIELSTHEYALYTDNSKIQNMTSIVLIYGRYYPNFGLYYAFQRDIASLDYPIAENLTLFYYDLLNADFYRGQIYSDMEYLAENPINETGISPTELAFRAKKFEEAVHDSGELKVFFADAVRLLPIVEKQLDVRYNFTPSERLSIYQ